jgi:hypothetical protein
MKEYGGTRMKEELSAKQMRSSENRKMTQAVFDMMSAGRAYGLPSVPQIDCGTGIKKPGRPSKSVPVASQTALMVEMDECLPA